VRDEFPAAVQDAAELAVRLRTVNVLLIAMSMLAVWSAAVDYTLQHKRNEHPDGNRLR
jgi:hypothetical protein